MLTHSLLVVTNKTCPTRSEVKQIQPSGRRSELFGLLNGAGYLVITMVIGPRLSFWWVGFFRRTLFVVLKGNQREPPFLLGGVR